MDLIDVNIFFPFNISAPITIRSSDRSHNDEVDLQQLYLNVQCNREGMTPYTPLDKCEF